MRRPVPSAMSSAGVRGEHSHPDAVEQATGPRRGRLRLATRWLFGLGVMAWTYLREPVPIRRLEERGDESDLPPSVPEALLDERSQPAETGHGPLFRRRFWVHVDDPRLTAHDLMDCVARDLTLLLPSEVAAVSPRPDPARLPARGDEFVVRMPGPWDGPVRVVVRDDVRLRLATLSGHLEAGQIEFRAVDEDDGSLRFEIETWARPAAAAVRLLYTDLRLAKEIQLYMWVRSCEAAAGVAGGRVRDGINVLSRRVEIARHGRRRPWPPPRE